MTNAFKPKIPKAPTPAAAPPAAKIEAPKRELGGREDEDLQKRRRRGRKGLRIDPHSGGVSGSGSGVNLPTK